jgi:hypothetical protein
MNLTGSHDRIVAQSERIKELESRLEISYKGFDQVESFRHSSTVERDYLRGRVKELEAEAERLQNQSMGTMDDKVLKQQSKMIDSLGIGWNEPALQSPSKDRLTPEEGAELVAAYKKGGWYDNEVSPSSAKDTPDNYEPSDEELDKAMAEAAKKIIKENRRTITLKSSPVSVDINQEMLEALIALTSNPHLDLGDLVYNVRERECEGWEGPSVVAWGQAVAKAKAALSRAQKPDTKQNEK